VWSCEGLGLVSTSRNRNWDNVVLPVPDPPLMQRAKKLRVGIIVREPGAEVAVAVKKLVGFEDQAVLGGNGSAIVDGIRQEE
jgi:hypothetical protein